MSNGFLKHIVTDQEVYEMYLAKCAKVGIEPLTFEPWLKKRREIMGVHA